MVGPMRKGKEQDKWGSRERDTGRQDPKEQAARGTGKRGERAKVRRRRLAVGTCAHRGSQGRDWVGVVVQSCQPSRQSSRLLSRALRAVARGNKKISKTRRKNVVND